MKQVNKEKLKWLSDLLYLCSQGEIPIDHTTGPWIARFAENKLVQVKMSNGIVKCLVGRVNKRGVKVIREMVNGARRLGKKQ